MTFTQHIKKLTTALIASTLVLSLGACAAQNPGNSFEESFSLLNAANAADAQTAPKGHQRGQKGKHGKRGGGQQMMFGMLMKDLNLSDSQKTQFKALMQSGRSDHQAMREQMKGFKEKLRTQFLSDKFDAAALKAEVAQATQSRGGEASQQMASKLVSAWQILTPEQQSKLETKLSEMETRFGKRQGKAPTDRQGKYVEHLKTKLGLSDVQVQQLEALKPGNSNDRAAQMTQMRQLKTQVLTQLKAGAKAEQIATLLAPLSSKMGNGFDKQIEKMQTLHAVLTPAQRQQMVDMMQQGHRGHQRPQKRSK